MRLQVDGKTILIYPNGTFRPAPPCAPSPDDQDTWITAAAASKVLGIPRRTIYSWLGEYLVYRRPTRSRYKISLQSVQDFKRALEHPDFWKDEERQLALKKKTWHRMRILIESSLQPGCN
ncbi:MAG TPA: hypothetical protein VEC99_13000 [Clostridia bacterium]|nr:hypothetical protein [Clostridia bacterium]